MTRLENHDIYNILSGLNHLIQVSNKELRNPAMSDQRRYRVEARLADLNCTFVKVTRIAAEQREEA